MGYGHSGQLGHGGRSSSAWPQVVEAIRSCKVVHIAAGAYHTVVVLHCGKLLTCGHGSCGQLGYSSEAEFEPRAIEGLVGCKITKVAAGGYQTMAWSSEGQLVTFGRSVGVQVGVDTCVRPSVVHLEAVI